MKVKDWSTECSQSDDFHNKPLFVFTCHLTSCAMRLYSIDEKKQYQRYRNYQDWWNNRQKGKKYFSSNNTGQIIHCVLRNLVAHSEDKCKGTKKRSYVELMNYYNCLSFDDIYSGIGSVIKAIENDLTKDGIIVDPIS